MDNRIIKKINKSIFNKKKIEKDIEICDFHTNNAISYMDNRIIKKLVVRTNSLFPL